MMISCLEVVCAGIYFDLKNGVVLPSYCLSTKVVLTLNHIQTLNIFVETFFSRQFFWFTVLLFVVCQETKRIFK